MARVFRRVARGNTSPFWSVEFYDSGRKISHLARGEDGRPLMNKAHAERALRDEMVDAHRRRREPYAVGDGSTKLADWLEVYDRDHVSRLRGARNVRFRLEYWREHFGAHARLRDVTRASIDRYLAQRASDVSGATLNRELAAISHAMTQALRAGLIPHNPAHGAKRGRESGGLTRHLSAEEQGRLLRAAREDGFAPVIVAILLALDAGGRHGEIVALAREDVDLRLGHVTFRHTKSGKMRHVPLTPRARLALKALLAEDADQHPLGGAKRELRRRFAAIRRAAKLGDDVKFHTLRHTFATRLAGNGVPITVIKELMGHSTIVMTMRYAHVSDAQTKDAIATLAGGDFTGSTAEARGRKKGRRRP